MKKKELVQLVMTATDMLFGNRTVAMHLGNAFNSVVGQLFARDLNQYQFYTKRITIDVLNRVTTLTIPLIQTGGNAKGVIRIMPTGSDSACLPDDTEFYPMPAFALRSSTDANSMRMFVFYTVTASTVRFNKSLPKEVTELVADVVPEFHAYLDNDFIQLPQGVAQMIVDAAVSSLKGDPSHANIYKKKA